MACVVDRELVRLPRLGSLRVGGVRRLLCVRQHRFNGCEVHLIGRKYCYAGIPRILEIGRCRIELGLRSLQLRVRNGARASAPQYIIRDGSS